MSEKQKKETIKFLKLFMNTSRKKQLEVIKRLEKELGVTDD